MRISAAATGEAGARRAARAGDHAGARGRRGEGQGRRDVLGLSRVRPLRLSGTGSGEVEDSRISVGFLDAVLRLRRGHADNGAPGLVQLGDSRNRPAEPDNPAEPVDAAAAANPHAGAATSGRPAGRQRRRGGAALHAAGTMACALFAAPYVEQDPRHQGLLVYANIHRLRVKSRAGWQHCAQRRGVHVGRIPPAGVGGARAAPGTRRPAHLAGTARRHCRSRHVALMKFIEYLTM